MITSYKQTKEEVLHIYEEFLKIVDEVELNPEDNSLKSLKIQSENIRNDKFSLMVAGEAKSGKSTFINAYLGTEILPMDLKQCTSSIIEIRYGDEFKLIATCAGGEKIEETNELEIKNFLTEKAAIKDEYREIPVTTINNEILLNYKGVIQERVIEDLVNNVRNENIYNLAEEEYSDKIRAYINNEKDNWMNIITKIEITYPFEDDELRGIQIIDSPGVNAQGRVGKITDEYIENADAIMFLKPIVGGALESTSFKSFIETASLDRNKEALFLIFTRAANATQEDLDKIKKEAHSMFSGIEEEKIICLDSKVELFKNKITDMGIDDIGDYLNELEEKKQLDSFIELPWYKCKRDKSEYIKKLNNISNFVEINNALNQFGRRAHYIALNSLLSSIFKIYTRIHNNIKEEIENRELKLEDPTKLALKIGDTKHELLSIQNKMYSTIDEVEFNYAIIQEGIIYKEAEKSINKLLEDIEENKDRDIDILKKICFRKIDEFKKFQIDLQQQIVEDCNKALTMLSNKKTIIYTSLEPDFSPVMFKEILDKTQEESYEYEDFTTGKTFKKTESRSVYSTPKHYKILAKNIVDKLKEIQGAVIGNLIDFTSKTLEVYREELKTNAEVIKNDLDELYNEKKSVEESMEIIKKLKLIDKKISLEIKLVDEIQGGAKHSV